MINPPAKKYRHQLGPKILKDSLGDAMREVIHDAREIGQVWELLAVNATTKQVH